MLKVVHDCRRDADALLHQYGVRLAHVFDTQATYATIKAAQASRKALARRASSEGGSRGNDPPATGAETRVGTQSGAQATSGAGAGSDPASGAGVCSEAESAPLAVGRVAGRSMAVAGGVTACASLGHLLSKLLGCVELAKENSRVH